MKRSRIVRAVARILVLVSIISMVSLFSGCSTAKVVMQQICAELKNRVEFNKEIAEILKSSKLIEEDEYNAIIARITDLENLTSKVFEDGSDASNFFKDLKNKNVNLFSALTAFRVMHAEYSATDSSEEYASSIDPPKSVEEYYEATYHTANTLYEAANGNSGEIDGTSMTNFFEAKTCFGTLLGMGAGWASFPLKDGKWPDENNHISFNNTSEKYNLNDYIAKENSDALDQKSKEVYNDINKGYWIPIDKKYIGKKPCGIDVSAKDQLWFNTYVRNGVWNVKYANAVQIVTEDQVSFEQLEYVRNKNLLDIKPIEIVSREIRANVQEKLDYEIYILRSDLDNKNESFETIFGDIRGWANKAEMDKKTGDEYFVSSGSKLKDFFGGIDELVKVTEPFDDKLTFTEKGQDAGTGKDLVLYQKAGSVDGDPVPIATIRLKEFNEEACKRANELSGILDIDGEGNTRYKVDSKNKRVYLMEYPVYAIDGIKKNGDKYSATFSESGIGINILSNKSCMKKYDYNTSYHTFMLSGKYIEPVGDSYIVSSLAEKSTSGTSINKNNSSFIVLGSAELIEKINNTDAKFTIPRIILIDYLEATYAPGFAADDSKLAVFGRKIRFLSLKKDTSGGISWSSLDDIVAGYVLPNGDSTTNQIKLRDLCDIQSLENSIVKVLGGEERNQESVKSVSKVAEISELKATGVDSILCAKRWEPGQREKMTQDTRQRFWIISVSNSMFNNGLLDTWIRSDDPNNSIVWWNDYLFKNNFDYSVEYEKVHNYLISSYKTQMRRFGEFVLDLDTINKVGDILKAEDELNAVKTIRTILILIGWALVAFSIILVVLWLIDTNTDLGLNLLTKATFGHWVAVKYKDDIPGDVTTNTKYVTGQKVVIRSLIIMTVGMFIIVFNALDLINWLINKFGLIAEEVEKLIRGL